ncbi:TonB-dependent receptor [Chryseobacterium sp.]|uniref:TonB-dependent receptor n=1 Tax=Chryseobacterium sp. TaxID=1871047 RepID=UPI003219F889
MKKSFSFFMFLCAPILFFAQITFTGKIIGEDNKPIEYAEVSLLTKDSIAVKSSLSNEQGNFILEAPQGSYIFIVKHFKQILHIGSVELTKTLNIGTVKADNTTNLKEVIIQKKRKIIERKVDRLIFNVENSISATGGDALDALKITPSIRVQNEQISMVGKSGMSLMVDDRMIQLSGEELMNFLRSIPSDNIKSIEVITNPPAKYDAEGNSGIVNIKLKKAKIDSWNAMVSSSYLQSTYPTGRLNASFDYKKNKINFFSNISYSKGSIKRTEKDEIYYPNRTWITDFNKRLFTDAIGGKIGFDYKLSKKWTIGTLYFGNSGRPESREEDFGAIRNSANQIDSLIHTNANTLKKNWSHSINIYNKIELDTLGRVITTDFDYLTWNSEDNRNFTTQNLLSNGTPTNNSFLSVNNLGNQKVQNVSGKFDVDYPFQGFNFAFGGKVSFIKTDYDFKYYNKTDGSAILDPNQSNSFSYNENTQALYVTGSKKFGKEKWETQVGLRMENTQKEGISHTLNQRDKNNYLELFPTFYLLYKANENNTYSINYGRRIERPRYSRLNPFRYYSSAYNYTEGNPGLLPQFSNNIELKHVFKDNLTTSITYTREAQGYGEVSFVNNNNQYFTQLNYFTNNNIQLSESYTFNKFSWWESSNQADLYYSTVSFTKDVNLEQVKGWGFYFSTNNTFVLNKKKTIKASINYWFQAPEYDLQNRNKGYSSLDIGVRFSFLQNKLLLNAAVQDIFRTNRSHQTTYTTNIKQIYSSYNDSRLFRLSLTYKFGSSKISAEKRYFGNEEEKGRTN